MKKLALLFVVVLVLAGCTQAAAPVCPECPVAEACPAVEPCPVVEPEAKAEGTYYWLAANNSNPFYVPGLLGWKAAAEDLNVNIKFVGPEDPNLADQIKTLEGLVANPETNGILFYAMDFNAGEPMVIEAEAKGIPVVYANTDSPFKTRSGFIGTDHATMGRQAAALAAELIDCKGSVGAIGNDSVVVPKRMKTFLEEVVNLCPDVKAEEMGLFPGDLTSALSTLDAYMIAHPDLTLLWWADGVAGQTVSPWKEKVDAGIKTLFLGSDMQPAALEAVKDGTWVATMGQDTFAEEYWGLQFLVAKKNGLAIPDSTLLSTMIITKDNVDPWLEVLK